MTYWRPAGALALVFALFCAPASAQDWPMFMADARHSGAVEATISDADIAKLKPVWRYRLPSQVSASPVVAGNRLFVAAENGNIYAFDLTTHALLWLYRAEAGIGSTPAIANGKLYFLGRDGDFCALDAATGKRLWRFKTGGEARFGVVGGYGMPKDQGVVPDPWDFYLSSPVVQDGKVYFGSSDHHVYALDALTGAKVWAFEADDSVHTSPALSDGRLFIATWGTKLYALDAGTGARLWDFQGGKDAKDGIFQGFVASSTVDGDTVYIGSRDAYMRAFDVATGKLRWAYNAEKSWVLATAAVDADGLYFPTSDTTAFIALDKTAGTEKYCTGTQVWTYTSTVLVGAKYAFVGTMTGELYGFDQRSGRVLWHYQTGESKADVLNIVDDATGKLRMDVLFPADFPPQAGVEKVKALGAFVASPIWSGNRLIAVTANGEIVIFGAGKR
jgi:outer membrane protein assembly factor BamB